MHKLIVQPGRNGLERERTMLMQMSSAQYEFKAFDALDATTPLNATPLGSVEYCQRIMELNGIQFPPHISYPEVLRDALKRALEKMPYHEAPTTYFVKPAEQVKAFTGTVKGELVLAEEEIPQDMPVFCSPYVDFVAEWRVYVLAGEILGFSRYDPNDGTYRLDIEFTKMLVELYGGEAPIGYAIDVGLMSDGRYALVEVNDAWALGFYPWGTMKFDRYLDLIARRWEQIVGAARLENHQTSAMDGGLQSRMAV